MKLPTINAESVYVHDDQAASVVHAGIAAREAGYQFMLHQMKLYLLGYWRDSSTLEYFELVSDEEDTRKLLDEIVENEAAVEQN